jgi:hypothetical protein
VVGSAFSFGKHETKRFRVVRARKNATDGAKTKAFTAARDEREPSTRSLT